jgi:hypothetical protein
MENVKSLDDLIKQVSDTGQGLSPQDLDALLKEVSVDPDIPTAQQAPAGQTEQPPTPPPKVEPNIQEFLPEELRDADAKSSAHKVTKTIADLKETLRKREEELAALQSLSQLPPPVAASRMPQPTTTGVVEEDLDDAAYWEKPKESIGKTVRQEATKIATAVAATMLDQYHQLQYRQRQIDEFARVTPDFELYREEMAAIARQRPDVEKLPNALSILYSAAKTNQARKADALRKQLGLDQKPAETPAPVQQNEDQIVEKVKAQLLAAIEKRRAAAGLAGGTTPSNPSERAADKVTAEPKTYDDEVMEGMLGSGPQKPLWERK